MTGPIRHQENANRAKAELAAVKAQASELIGDLVALVKSMYVLGDCDKLNFNGRPVGEIVGDLWAADSAAEMQAAFGDKP